MIRLLFTSGRGPVECRIALRHALLRLAEEAAACGVAVDVAYGRNADGHGPASAVAVLDGASAGPLAKAWEGSIQWIAQSPVRAHCKRKNWFIGVIALSAQAATPGAVHERDVRFDTLRAGGPGGQHQNKTESAVRAVHMPSGLSVVAREERSQHRNKAAALTRLAGLMQAARELSEMEEKRSMQAAHDALIRGRAARRFEGSAFVPKPG